MANHLDVVDQMNEIDRLRAELVAKADEYVRNLAIAIDTRDSEIEQLCDELAATKEALKPFADLRVTRFMTDGLTYNFRVDAAWIRKARAVGGMED